VMRRAPKRHGISISALSLGQIDVSKRHRVKAEEED
jgi:hypothetical protein